MSDDLVREPPRKLMVAWTQDVANPPYVNVTQVGSMVQINVRGEPTREGVGSTVSFTVNFWTWGQLCKVIRGGEYAFEAGLDNPPSEARS